MISTTVTLRFRDCVLASLPCREQDIYDCCCHTVHVLAPADNCAVMGYLQYRPPWSVCGKGYTLSKRREYQSHRASRGSPCMRHLYTARAFGASTCGPLFSPLLTRGIGKIGYVEGNCPPLPPSNYWVQSRILSWGCSVQIRG